jgi:hypothetical protein
LYGPVNDVLAWAKLLTEPAGFAFPQAHVTQLVGWPDDVAKRPTRANIAKGFAELAANAGPGDRIVIVLSGHGTQLPVPVDQDPLDPKNFKPDGLDEAFLPADVRYGSNGLENHILDREIGAWLDRILEKGADVLVVLDCCHSGTMTRSALDVERTRLVRPQALGIPDKDVEAAAKRAREAVNKSAKEGKPRAEATRIGQRSGPKGRGHLVTFYAAQPFETTPELPLPGGAPHTRENYYGLLNYTLIQALRQRQNPITYRELSQVIVAQYRASRGTRGPLPYAEGDLDREVLGFKEWPNRGRVVLRNAKNKPLRVSAGQLDGLTPESVLAVYPPAIDSKKRDAMTILGYVRVKTTSLDSAEVDPCEYEKKPAAAPSDLDDLCRCEIVCRDYGDTRIRLFLGDNPVLQQAFAKMDKDVQEMILVVQSPTEAEWVLRPVDPRGAEEYGLKLAVDAVVLLRGDKRKPDAPDTRKEAEAAAEHLARLGKPGPRRVFATYPVKAELLANKLQRDLAKVFRWQNVLKVAGGVAGEKGGDSLGLKVEVTQLKDKDDKMGQVLRGASLLARNALLEFRVDNTKGTHNLWVVALWLDADLQIRVYEVIEVAASASAAFAPASIALPSGASGAESLVVFAFPQSVQRERPDFGFLNQSPLRAPETVSRKERKRQVGDTPFAQLLERSALSGGTNRVGAPIAKTTPAVIIQSWFVAP